MSDGGDRGVETDSIDVVDTSHPLATQMGLTLGELLIRDQLTPTFHVGNVADGRGTSVVSDRHTLY